MLLRLRLIFVSVLLTLSYGFSQSGLGTIKGSVIDAETKEPIPYCKVLLYSEGQIKGGENTDFDGIFQINSIAPGKYDIEVRNEGEGYQSQRLEGVVVNSDKITFLYDLTLGKPSDVQEIEEVKVTAYIVPLIDQDGGSSGQTLTRDDISKLAARSASAVAATAGGVQQSEDDGSISVRGSRSDATYFYIDGIKVRGSTNLPKSAIQEVSVITGGLPANYGDATGGIISIITRGPSSEYFGSVEAVTSGFYFKGSDPDGYDGKVFGLDKYSYNLLEAMLSGPLLMKKDSTGRKTKPILGFLVSANYTTQLDSRPLHGGSYRIKKDVRDMLLETPLIRLGDGSTRYTALYLREDDFEKTPWRMNARTSSLSGQAKIDVNTGPSVNLSFGGSYNFSWGNLYSRRASLFNFFNFGAYKSSDWRVFGRLTQRFTNDEEGSSSKIKSALYTLMVDYSKTKRKRFDPKHGYNLFNYGHVGYFDLTRERTYDGISNIGPVQEVNPPVVRVDFRPSDLNPMLAAQTEQYFNLFEYAPHWTLEQNYRNLDQVRQGNGLLNGDIPQSVYQIWDNIGAPYNSFRKIENDQIRVTGMGSANIGDHSVSLGFEYEQRYDRGWEAGDNGPIGLWQIARQYTNAHISQIDLSNPTYIYDAQQGVTYTSYEPLNTGYAYTSGTGEYGGALHNDKQFFFDYNLRKYLSEQGLISSGVAGTEFLNIDQYDPNIYSLDMFSPDELFNSGDSYVSYWGYDHTGKKVKGQTDINKYFEEFDENGNYKRFIGAYQPTYIAGFLMDKFSFRDIVFNVGVRVDIFDANQPVLKDKYLVYTARTVDEAKQVLNNDPSLTWIDIPESMGGDYVVYVDDVNNPNAIKGFRNGDTWYDATGTEVLDPKLIEGPGGIAPYLHDPNATTPTADAFEDYKAQINVMPRISFSFPISEEASFFAHYDILTKRPTTGVRFDPYEYHFLANRNQIINNSNLRPERTIDYEFGFQQVVTPTSSIKISAFYREQRDNVQLINVTGAYPRTYRTFGNRDFGTVKGMTVSYDMRRTGNLRMLLNYTLQFAEGTGTDATSAAGLINAGLPNLRSIFPYDFDRRHVFNIVLDYRYGSGKSYKGPMLGEFGLFESTGVNLTTNISSGAPYSKQIGISNEGQFQPQGGGGLDGTLNGSRMPWSYRTDLQIDRNIPVVLGGKKGEGGKKGKEANLNVYFRVTNIFNQRNVLSVYRATGNWDDDGYLAAASSQSTIQNQTDEQSFRDYYLMKIQNPFNISAPRTIRLGVRLEY